MSLAGRFPKAPERVLGAFTHLDKNLQSFFTPLREKSLGDWYEQLSTTHTAKTVDEAIKVKWAKNTDDWRRALRAYSLVYLINAFGGGDTGKPAKIVDTGRDKIAKLDKKSIPELDELTKQELHRLRPYAKYDKNITLELQKYLEKPFVQDPHLNLLIDQKKLAPESGSAKGICMGFVVRWVSYQMKSKGIVRGKHTGTKFLERKPEDALDIENTHVVHGKKVVSSEKVISQLNDQKLKVTQAKGKEAKFKEQQQFNDLLLYQTAELTVETMVLTLQRYGLALDKKGVEARSFTALKEYNAMLEDFTYSPSDCKPLVELIARLKAPNYFILSIKWMGSHEKGAHVWAGVLTNDGFRLFDPNMGTFFTNTNRAALAQAMCEKWAKEDRAIQSCVYLPVTTV
jgi:hypothetical protein